MKATLTAFNAPNSALANSRGRDRRRTTREAALPPGNASFGVTRTTSD
ncbi:hypothetical protein [Kibdelosporangium philippinense]